MADTFDVMSDLDMWDEEDLSAELSRLRENLLQQMDTHRELAELQRRQQVIVSAELRNRLRSPAATAAASPGTAARPSTAECFYTPDGYPYHIDAATGQTVWGHGAAATAASQPTSTATATSTSTAATLAPTAAATQHMSPARPPYAGDGAGVRLSASASVAGAPAVHRIAPAGLAVDALPVFALPHDGVNDGASTAAASEVLLGRGGVLLPKHAGIGGTRSHVASWRGGLPSPSLAHGTPNISFL